MFLNREVRKGRELNRYRFRKTRYHWLLSNRRGSISLLTSVLELPDSPLSDISFFWCVDPHPLLSNKTATVHLGRLGNRIGTLQWVLFAGFRIWIACKVDYRKFTWVKPHGCWPGQVNAKQSICVLLNFCYRLAPGTIKGVAVFRFTSLYQVIFFHKFNRLVSKVQLYLGLVFRLNN